MDDMISIESGVGLSFKEIAMGQFQKLVNLCNVEFRGGFYTTDVLSNGQTKELYVCDTRETFCNALRAFIIVIMPRFDDDMTDGWNDYLIKMKTIEDNFIKQSTPDETVILGEGFYIEDRDRILLETYKNKKLLIHLTLFTKVSMLLGKKNYFTIGGVTV